MSNEKPQFEETNNPKKNLDLGEVINNAFEIYKKTALIGGLAFIVLMSAIMMFTSIGISYFIGIEKFPEMMKNFNPDTLSLNEMALYYTIVIAFTVLIAPFVAGMLKIAHDADSNEEVSIASMYSYVNSPQFLDILLVTAIVSFFSIGINLFFKYTLPNTTGEILGFVTSYSVSILTFIAIPLVLFKKLNFIQAIQSSCTSVAKHFFSVLLLMIVAGLFAAIGIFAFCIGFFFTIPFAYAVQYSIYKRLS